MGLLSRSFSRNTFRNSLNASSNIIPQQNFSQSKLHSCAQSQILCNNSPYICNRDSIRYASTDSYLNSILKNSIMESLTQNDNVYFVQQKLIDFHDITGLPWWGVIITTTVVLRSFIVFPLAVHQQYVVCKNAEISKLMNTTVKNEVSAQVSKLAEKHKWSGKELESKYHDEMDNRLMALQIKHNCHPLKNLILVLVQLPIWFIMSSSIRNLNSMLPIRDSVSLQAYLEMKASGFGILKDLTIPDATWTIPILTVIVNLIIIEINVMSQLHKRHWLRKLIVLLMRLFSIVTLPIVLTAPKCMTLFWLTSSLCGLVQNVLFLSSRTRKILRIPPNENIRKHPFTHIKNRIKSVFYFFKH